MTAERLSDEQYDELLTVVYGSNIRSELAGAVLNLIREHRQLLAERAETARLREAAKDWRYSPTMTNVARLMLAIDALAEPEG